MNRVRVRVRVMVRIRPGVVASRGTQTGRQDVPVKGGRLGGKMLLLRVGSAVLGGQGGRGVGC